MVADCDNYEIGENAPSYERCVANARLVAATLELLAAGKHMAVKLAEVYRAAGLSPIGCKALEQWMLAVAKAEGRTS